MKNKIFLGALLCAVAFSSYALGQQNAQPDDVKAFETEMESAESAFKLGEWKDTLRGSETAVSSAEKAAGNRTLTHAAVKHSVASYYSTSDPKAPIRLQALQIAQNQRIIELLEQANRK